MQWYPKIDSIVDSFNQTSEYTLNRRLPLEVGDEVTFTCRGTDPQGRELIWTLHTNLHRGGRTLEARGADVSLTWKVAEGEVMDWATVTIRMSSNSQYHRWGIFDEEAPFHYSVEPPS